MGLLQLLSDVLPSFVAVGKFIASSDDQEANEFRDDLSEKLPVNFYVDFYAEIYGLHAVVSSWDWVQEPDERELRKILDELESRFLSTTRLIKLGWTISDRTRPLFKLQTLQRKLRLASPPKFENSESEDGNLEDREFEEDQEHKYLNILKNAVHISQGEVDRKRLLKRLRKGYLYLHGLSNTYADHPISQFTISRYPYKNVRNSARLIYNFLQKHWSCTCPENNPHRRRETQFNLTTHRRFETTPEPVSSQEKNTDAKFDILFPTNSEFLEWQECEIHVMSHSKFDNLARELVSENICELIRDAQRFRLKMQVDGNDMWKVKQHGIKRVNDIQQSKFLSLGDLIKWNKGDTEAIFSRVEGRDRLILSYILAVSLLQLYEGPWLQNNWSNETICFLINAQNRGRPNFTKPLLTASCTKLTSRRKAPDRDQVHSYPSILALGIMLLEISLATTMDLEREEKEKQNGQHVTSGTDFLVALRLFDHWVEQSQISISKAIPRGLKTAIEACLNPSKIPYTDPPPSNQQVLQYILTNIVIPLGTAVSDTYEIPLEKLHEEIGKDKQQDDPYLFDSYDDRHTATQKRTATKWFDQDLKCVHRLLEEFDELPNEHKHVGRVTVAVIDTGFEPSRGLMENYEQANRIKESKSWVTSERDQEANSENWRKDLDGHGTQVTYLLLRVAPVADVHIARVFKTRQDLQDPTMAATVHQRIASAIDYATNIWKVDIMIMSFGFEEPVIIIDEAIKKASSIKDKSTSSTLIFAATQNDGANKRVAWPAREVIGISSTDGNGQHSSFNPHDDGSYTIFYALGQAVEVACPSHFCKLGNKMRVSGTSFANPVAAGLAANVLGYARLAVKNKETMKEHRYMLDRLKSKDGMKAVLRHLMTMKNNSDKPCLLPWEFLKRGRPGILNDILETLKTR